LEILFRGAIDSWAEARKQMTAYSCLFELAATNV